MRAAAMTARPAAIGALWFGIQAVWGAILGVSLQARSTALGVDDPVAAYALIASLGAALAALTQVAVGFFSDARRVRVGHRRDLYLAGIALALPALVAFYLAPTYPILLGAFVALQIGMNVLGGPYQAAVPDHVPPQRRGAASAWMSGYQFFGQCTGLLIVSFTHDVVAGLSLAAALAISFAVTFAHLARMPDAATVRPRLRVDRDFRTLLASRGLINLGFYTFVGYMFFFVRDTLHPADPRQTTGILFLAFTIAGVIGATLAGRPSDTIDKRIVVSLAGLAIALTIGALAGASTLPVILIAGTLAGVAWGAFFTADWAIAYVVLPSDAMAAAMGVWNLAAALPQIAAPLLGAAVFATFGIRATLILVIVEFALGTLWLWRLPALTARAAR